MTGRASGSVPSSTGRPSASLTRSSWRHHLLHGRTRPAARRPGRRGVTPAGWMLGQRRHAIARMVRRRELAVVHPGVYVDHTGTLTWKQRAWAAVLLTWPAALSHDSAVRAGEGPGHPGSGTTTHSSTSSPRPGPGWRRSRGWPTHVAAVVRRQRDCATQPTARPGCRAGTGWSRCWVTSRRAPAPCWNTATSPASSSRTACRSAAARHSHRHSGVTTYRDVEYDGHDLVVELDGRVHHGSAGERDRDMDRDLEAAVGGTETLRVSYGQVYDRPCLTAARIVEVLRRRGWTRQLVRCAHCG